MLAIKVPVKEVLIGDVVLVPDAVAKIWFRGRVVNLTVIASEIHSQLSAYIQIRRYDDSPSNLPHCIVTSITRVFRFNPEFRIIKFIPYSQDITGLPVTPPAHGHPLSDEKFWE